MAKKASSCGVAVKAGRDVRQFRRAYEWYMSQFEGLWFPRRAAAQGVFLYVGLLVLAGIAAWHEGLASGLLFTFFGPPDVISTLVRGLQRDRGSLRAAAIAADVRTSDSDAVRVELEHRDGHAFQVLMPYKKERVRRGVEYGTLSAAPGRQQIWSA